MAARDRLARPKPSSAPDEALEFAAAGEAAEDGQALLVALDGYEGPLHLLLALARAQKVDLAKVSIARLAEQYLSFIETAERLRIEVAADYLVMAAWLALLKSRLLLPREETVDPDDPRTPEEIARALAFRLKRLAAMRAASAILYERDLLDRDVAVRGAPEGVRRSRSPIWTDTVVDLLKAYGTRRSITAQARVRFPAPNVYALETARREMRRRLAASTDWDQLGLLLPQDDAFAGTPPSRASRMASALVASLELARDGAADVRQDVTFGPVWVRARRTAEAAA